MSAPLRLLLTHGGDPAGRWRVVFDLVQAAAALDVALELGFAGAGLELIELGGDGPRRPCASAYASLQLLGVESVRLPAGSPCMPREPALPLRLLDDVAWRAWLRAAPLQVW